MSNVRAEPGRPISPGEMAAIRAVAAHGSVRAAAEHLGIHRQTLKNQLGNVYVKLDVFNFKEACAELGLIPKDRAPNTGGRIGCDECPWPSSHLVAGPHGELRLCGGCFADLKATGAKARIVRFPQRSAA